MRFLLSALFLLMPTLVLAQAAPETLENLPPAPEAGLSLTTSPLPLTPSTPPGQPVTVELRVKNNGSETEYLKLTALKFGAYEDTGKPSLMDGDASDEFLKWVTFPEPVFSVEPNEWKTVQAVISPPESAAFGYYYAFVFSRANENLTPESGETAVAGGTAVLALLEVVVPGAKREIALDNFSLDRGFYEFLPATFSVRLENKGNVHAAPRGNIFINQGERKDIALLEVNKEKGNILPSSIRTFEVVWNDGFPRYVPRLEDGKEVKDEEGNTIYELQWNWQDISKLRIGKYTAKLVLVYDDGTRDIPIEGQLSFWVIPWRALLVLLVITLLILLGLRSVFKNIFRSLFRRKENTV